MVGRVRTRQLLVIALVLLMVQCATEAAEPPPAPPGGEITVHTEKSGPSINPMLYGIFFEEINCSGDGGIYAELVRNRSFEDSSQPDYWSQVQRGVCQGSVSIDKSKPVAPFNKYSLCLRITDGGDGFFGVANDGYGGIPVEKGQVYNLSLFARAGDGLTGPVVVRIESGTGETYAEGTIVGLTDSWQRFAVALTPDATDPKARLVLGAGHTGSLWVDQVSLFPKNTWKGRANGLRADIADMVAGLKPSFVRFPGGCWIEGSSMASAPRWKQTVGDVSARVPQPNLWSRTQSTSGLGYHEYLQMCEDMEAAPLFIANCGMAHDNVAPLGDMQNWVQDALDAIEYANGPVQSKWGALRARNGHPAPFNMKYIGIGNEEHGPAYEERYAMFYDTIKKKYPGIKLVATAPTKSRPADIVDEHYYFDAGYFFENADMYDSYDRTGPKVYVGEYAVTVGCGQGNLLAALGEAAFMTGMERNSDVVVMASYAPLLCNVNFKRWNPDLIYFDGSRCYGTPSYYVQQMFSENRGDVVVPMDLQLTPQPSARVKAGGITLGTWETQVDYKDITVKHGNNVLYAGDFSKGMDGWKAVRGVWSNSNGALRQKSSTKDTLATFGDPSWTDYTVTLKARKLSGNEGFLIGFSADGSGNWARWNLGGWANSKHGVECSQSGFRGIIGKETPGSIQIGKWYDIRIEVSGRHVKCYLDGVLLVDADYPQDIRRFVATASRDRKTGEVILKAVNASSDPQPMKISLPGAKTGQKATAIILQSVSPDDENSFEQPKKVAPVTKSVDAIGPAFDYTFHPYSVTILRLPMSTRSN